MLFRWAITPNEKWRKYCKNFEYGKWELSDGALIYTHFRNVGEGTKYWRNRRIKETKNKKTKTTSTQNYVEIVKNCLSLMTSIHTTHTSTKNMFDRTALHMNILGDFSHTMTQYGIMFSFWLLLRWLISLIDSREYSVCWHRKNGIHPIQFSWAEKAICMERENV